MSINLQTFNGRLGDGAWLGVPMPTYQAHPATSSTLLRVLLESPLTYRRMVDGEIAKETTAPMEFGTAMHAALFEQRNEFHVQPEVYGPENKKWNNNATECKKWREDHSDKTILSITEATRLLSAVGYMRAHPKAQKYLRGGHCEVSLIHGNRKARPDYLIIHPDNTCTIVDLKTTTDASDGEVSKEILNRGYHIQFAWYRMVCAALGLTVIQVVILALQKGKLPLLNVVEVSPRALRLGEEECERGLEILELCQLKNQWPEWVADLDQDEVRVVELPEYAYAGSEIEIEIGGERAFV